MFFAYRGTSLLMTVSAAPTAPPTDEELLIQEALRQRRRQRTGRSLAGALVLAAFFLVVGFLLAVYPGLVTYGVPYSFGVATWTLPSSFSPSVLTAVLMACGGVALITGASFLAVAVSGFQPRAPWGDPTPGDCPACGRPGLRSGEVTVWEASTLNVVATGTVTLCETPGCPHASASPARR
jgi:hypothetical protein